MKDYDSMTRDQLEAELDLLEAETPMNLEAISQVRYLTQTICVECQKPGASQQYDQEGIYVTRKHDECLSDHDKHLMRYEWQPGDEPLEEPE